MAFVSLLQSAIRFSAVFLFGSTGETISQKSGHLNLGTPGVMCLGALGGAIGVSIAVNAFGSNGVGFLYVLFGILFALLFGGIAGALFSFFTINLKCNQNVTGLTLTTLGSGIFSYGFKNLVSTSIPSVSKHFRDLFHAGNDGFSQIFLSHGILVYLAIILAIAVTFFFSRTKIGLRLRTVGESPSTADASGINVTKYRYIATIVGCAVSALGGLFMIMDYNNGSVEYNVAEYGWLAVAIVIFSMWKPSIAIGGSFLFGFLYILPYKIGLSFSDTYLIKLLPYFITIIILIITSMLRIKSAQPPSALGLTYDREER